MWEKYVVSDLLYLSCFRVAYTHVHKDRIGFSLLCRMLSLIHFVLHNPWN